MLVTFHLHDGLVQLGIEAGPHRLDGVDPLALEKRGQLLVDERQALAQRVLPAE